MGRSVLVEPNDDLKELSSAVRLCVSMQIVGAGVGDGVSLGGARFMLSPPSMQISVTSTSSTHGTLKRHPHFLPVHPQ